MNKPRSRRGAYEPNERKWVMRLVAKLTPEQRRRYEAECAAVPRHHAGGKLYDRTKAEIAERILLEDLRGAPHPRTGETS